ncbi:lipid asymmetry maintenance protein MlaB [Morganella morganii]|uniref:Lipid asymmetry maintenance protein MlaB n=1 Tax=Morganella morganii TaxID=582 RepID=A0A9Q4GR98_MORMO|nr:lipid asymmetry maintenance protein MlaB [Morganella morganii]BEP19886.1 lipid asymmetry maintenance protein MlaB [Morganella morganii subsp. sibonii]EJD6037283.1 lipid asymmetry maintenance protein MlaB [Morganella morganii]EKK5375833.1 lipid asymmetry maintenance protein MlaB [Morganella morganii]EKW7745191.1 lipid asymmetry maintenance protein MlaB [Morganella morganii]ELB1543676.1 lipid asymmetry maintenance protein MlaB [Morganella morganii]
MTAALTWEKQGETLALKGELDRDTLLSFWNARQQQMNAVQTVDVSGLSHVDSAGLAMLVRLRGERPDAPFVLSGVSANLQMLMSLYGVEFEFSQNA